MSGRVADAGKPTETGQDPLNFRVSAAFRREFKTYAASHDLKLNELLVKSFESYRDMQKARIGQATKLANPQNGRD
jgi:hypothetical protein